MSVPALRGFHNIFSLPLLTAWEKPWLGRQRGKDGLGCVFLTPRYLARGVEAACPHPANEQQCICFLT